MQRANNWNSRITVQPGLSLVLRGPRLRSLAVVGVLRHSFERHRKHPSDLERNLERGRVPPLFDGDNGLSGHADALSQLRLVISLAAKRSARISLVMRVGFTTATCSVDSHKHGDGLEDLRQHQAGEQAWAIQNESTSSMANPTQGGHRS
jgi:hypothetical protein